MTRVALYARYSDDLQNPASIEDQLRICREHAARQGWRIVQEYSDAAVSGAFMLNRPEVQRLIRDAAAGRFEVVLAEALDRVSRGLKDTAGLFEQLSYNGVKIVTLAEGEISELHVGFKGTMNALFLKDMAAKVRRGARGRIEAGKAVAGLPYGYRVVTRIASDGAVIRGEREIVPEEAEVILGVFRDYAAGRAPRKIAHALNVAGVPGPRGRQWNASTINGSAGRGNGILHNEIYVGRLIYNRQTFRKNPSTGRRVPKLNPREQWIVREVPELRIVPDDLWVAAHGIRRAMNRTTLSMRHRPRHPLSGLLRCGCCGGSMIVVQTGYLGCSRAKETGACTNTRRVGLELIERRVIDGIREHMLAPEVVKSFIEEYRQAMQAESRTAVQRGADLQRRIDRLTTQIKALVRAVADDLDTPDMRAEMKRLTAERDGLQADLAAAQAPSVVALHPEAAEAYRAELMVLQEALRDEETREEAIAVLRSLVAEVKLTPLGGRLAEMRCDLTGTLAGLKNPAVPLAETFSFALAGSRSRGIVGSAGRI